MVSPQSRSVSAATAVARADSFAAGAQASSRSRNTRSAPAACGDLAHVLVTRGCRELAAAGPGRLGHRMLHSVQMVPAARRSARRSASRPSRSRYTVSLSAPSARPRCAMWPGVSLNRADGRLHGHRAQVWIVDRHEGASRTQVFVGEKLLCVVNRCGRDVFGEEHLHRIVERMCADPRRRPVHRSHPPVPGAESGRRIRDGLRGRACRWPGRGARRRSTMHSRSRSIGHRRCGRRFVVRWHRPDFRCGPGSGPSWS